MSSMCMVSVFVCVACMVEEGWKAHLKSQAVGMRHMENAIARRTEYYWDGCLAAMILLRCVFFNLGVFDLQHHEKCNIKLCP